MRKLFIIDILIIAFVLAIDMLVKMWAGNSLSEVSSIEVIPNFFYLTYVENTGGAWGMLAGNIVFLVVVGIAAVIGFSYYYLQHYNDRLTQIAMVLMIAGAIGNLFDRAFLGYVRDMFDFYIFGYNFPVFNIADMSLIIGSGLLLLSVILEIKNEDKD